jgi:hypothetical protein
VGCIEVPAGLEGGCGEQVAVLVEVEILVASHCSDHTGVGLVGFQDG